MKKLITAKTKICMIIGDPIEHSLSPQMHNAAYKEIGIDDKYVFTAAKVRVGDIKKVVEAVKALAIRGITCTIPHKVEILKYLDTVDPIAKKIGAANTVVNENGKLIGYNTDWIGVLKPLEERIALKNKQIALIGAGGAARAIAYAVTSRGGKLTIYNRSIDKAKLLAEEFGGVGKSLQSIAEIMRADVILNATSIGMQPDINQSPVAKEYLHGGQVVFDAVYSPQKTRLLMDAGEKGAKIIYGSEMLLHQAVPQFELYTGKKAPIEIMKKTIESLLNV